MTIPSFLFLFIFQDPMADLHFLKRCHEVAFSLCMFFLLIIIRSNDPVFTFTTSYVTHSRTCHLLSLVTLVLIPWKFFIFFNLNTSFVSFSCCFILLFSITVPHPSPNRTVHAQFLKHFFSSIARSLSHIFFFSLVSLLLLRPPLYILFPPFPQC